MKLNEKLIEKAKEAKTAEELYSLAKELGFELTEEEAKNYFAQLNSKGGELADDELDNVAGGRKCGTTYKNGKPVITFFNCCDFFEVWKEGVDWEICGTCKYKGYDGMYVCDCPERYEN